MDHGNTPVRGQLAVKMLYDCGLEHIPIFIGRPTPGIVGEHTAIDESKSDQMVWADGFNKLKPNTKPAAEFIIETLNKYPGEVILFTVDPVVNFADVIDKDPEALKNAKQVVSMFGSVEKGSGGDEPTAEWNVRGSIEAGKKLMTSGVNILLAPLNCNDHVIVNDQYLTAIFNRQTPLTDALGALYALWWKHADWATHPKMCDGVAIGMVLWPELFKTKDMFVYVDDNGFTKVDKTKSPNCIVGLKIDDKEFVQRLYRRLVEQNYKRD